MVTWSWNLFSSFSHSWDAYHLSHTFIIQKSGRYTERFYTLSLGTLPLQLLFMRSCFTFQLLSLLLSPLFISSQCGSGFSIQFYVAQVRLPRACLQAKNSKIWKFNHCPFFLPSGMSLKYLLDSACSLVSSGIFPSQAVICRSVGLIIVNSPLKRRVIHVSDFRIYR